MKDIYDVIIIGGGPAGYTAGLYGVRAGLKVLLIEKIYPGGQIAISHQVDNYPGFENGIDGFTLAQNMKNQAEKFGLVSKIEEVQKLEIDNELKVVKTDGYEYLTKTIIIATGASPKELGVLNEKEYTGKGVHYCANCDAMFYKNKTVMVVGGGDTALSDALLLSRVAKEVIVVHRRDSFRGTKIYQDNLFKTENVSVIFDSQVKELIIKDKFSGVILQNVKTKENTEVLCDGVFVCIGRKPATEFIKGQIDLNESGYIIADESTKTNIKGVYAVGDVRTKAVRQVVTAVSDGATAIHYIESLLTEKN